MKPDDDRPADPINLAAKSGMTDLRHTWEPMGRYTCPTCGEVTLHRDPNDLCPAKVALRLATKDAEVNRLTAELADARAKALEEAARVCEAQIEAATILDSKCLGLSEPAACRELARRIRSLTPKAAR